MSQSVKMDKVLRNVPYDKAFQAVNGKFIHSLGELASEINFMNHYDFNYHVGIGHDHFSRWVREAIGDRELADKLSKIKDKDEYIKTIEKRVHKLTKKAEKVEKDVFAQPEQKEFKIRATPILIIIIIILLVVSFTQSFSMTKIDESYEDKIMTAENKALSLEYEKGQLEAQLNDLMNRNYELEKIAEQKNKAETSIELKTPSERIKMSDVHVYPNKVILNIKGPLWSRLRSTGSMIPVFDENSKLVQVEPSSYNDIKVGDVISYQKPNSDEVIVHRVIEIASDEGGWYAITKGDNNAQKDTQKVRFDEVTRVLVAIIY